MAVKAGAPRATALSVQRRRRRRRHGARPDPHHDLACRRRRARARREGHGQVDDGARPRLGAAADRGHRRRPVLAPTRASRTRCRPTARSRPMPRPRPARPPRRAAGRRHRGPRARARCTWRRRSARASPTYEPGLLARAHRGILYVDEVNLLHDHLVDLLLDAAAMGRSTVERDGVSVEHAARFVLVGTMNPEEGELRPQLLDRFGLTVEVARTARPRVAGRGRPAPARLRSRSRRVRRALRRGRGRAHRPHPGRAEAGRPGRARRRGRSPRSPRSAPRSRSTACAPTSSPPAPPPPTPRGTAAPTCSRRTSAPPPASRCRTAAGATRSTRPASTRTCSTQILDDDEPEPTRPRTAAERGRRARLRTVPRPLR